jgi:hypothetical protein
MGGGGGGRQSSPPPPIPSSPTRWLYDRTGDPVQLQEYGHYVRNGDGFTLVNDNNNPAPGSGMYLSPQAAEAKNPKVWLYDNKGKTTKQIFKGGEGPDDPFDANTYNLGPDSTPYRHWYDIYGVSQVYAPTTTKMDEGYWESPSLAPKSPTFQAPQSFNEADPSMNVQPDGNTGNADLAAQKNQSKKRRAGAQRQLTVLGDDSSMGGTADDSKNLLGE